MLVYIYIYKYHAYCVYYIYCVLRIFYVHIYNVLYGTPEYIYIYIYTLGLNSSNFSMVLPRGLLIQPGFPSKSLMCHGRGSSNFSTGSCYTQTIENIRTLFTIISIYTYVYIYINCFHIYIYICIYTFISCVVYVLYLLCTT